MAMFGEESKGRPGVPDVRQTKKIIDHRGIFAMSVLHPLARLGLGRALALLGDMDNSHRAYEEFLALWKDADPDIPILQEAKAEYAKLSNIELQPD